MTIKSCRVPNPEPCKPIDTLSYGFTLNLWPQKPSLIRHIKLKSPPDGVQCAVGLNMGLISFRDTYIQ